MLSPANLNPDGSTMFCFPYETELRHSYLIRTKAGNIDGYSSLISVVPELQFGISFLWNGQVFQEEFFRIAYDYLIPALVTTLKSKQSLPPLPPNPQMFFGNYSLGNNTVAQIFLSSKNDALLLNVIGLTAILEWQSGLTFTLYIPPWLVSCMANAFMAFSGEYVQFYVDQNSNVVSFLIPGAAYGITFHKESEI